MLIERSWWASSKGAESARSRCSQTLHTTMSVLSTPPLGETSAGASPVSSNPSAGPQHMRKHETALCKTCTEAKLAPQRDGPREGAMQVGWDAPAVPAAPSHMPREPPGAAR
eukprot:scaffold10326_cov31-Tisochrysis_lutea.AAC.7